VPIRAILEGPSPSATKPTVHLDVGVVGLAAARNPDPS